MITIELTEEQLAYLLEAARQHGRCSVLTETIEGQSAVLAVTGNHRRSHKAKPRPEPDQPRA